VDGVTGGPGSGGPGSGGGPGVGPSDGAGRPGAAAWPVATLDRIARLRALAAGLPGTAVHERVIDAPFDLVWGFVSDLERSVPEFDREVSRVRIVRSDGERVRIHSWAPYLPVPLPFDVTLRPGWCWMVGDPQIYVVGMAAEDTGDGRTRFGHLEGLVVGGPGPVRRAAAPLLRLSRFRHERHVGRDLDGIERAVARRLRAAEG
jgi:hypothetical protein